MGGETATGGGGTYTTGAGHCKDPTADPAGFQIIGGDLKSGAECIGTCWTF